MTERPYLSAEQTLFAERVEILQQELELAIRWKRSALLLVAYGSDYIRADSVALLENFLMDRGQKVIWLHADGPEGDSLHQWAGRVKDAGNIVFCVDGFQGGKVEPENLHTVMNSLEYLMIEKGARIILWLTCKEVSVLSHAMPHLWLKRQRLVEFLSAPKPEQIIQKALEAAWLGTGEYGDQFEDTDAKIALRESFLTELPRDNESSGLRGNLLLNLGVLHWRRGDYEKADELLGDALKIATKLQDTWFEAECFNAVALVKSSLGKNDEAIDAYKQAIKLAPDQILAWNNLGNLCLKIGRNDEAMIAFQKALHQNSRDSVAWNGIGDVYSRSEYADDAVAAYRKSIEFEPTLPRPWNGLGDVYARMGRMDEAIIAYQRAVKLNPQFTLPLLRMAELYAGRDRHRDAVKAYQRALQIDPGNSNIWNELGCVHYSAGKYEDAVESFLKSIECDRSNGWAYCNLGLAHASFGKTHEAEALYLKSIDLLKDDADKSVAWNRLANCYRITNDYDKALEAYQQADALTPRANLILTGASDDQTADPALQGDSVPAAESSPTSEGNAKSEDENVQDAPREEAQSDAPFWVFQPMREFDHQTTPARETRSHDTITEEIGGASMQFALPFFAPDKSRKIAVSRSEEKPRQAQLHQPDPASASAWNEKGNELFRAGAYEEASQAYGRAIQLDRSFGRPYCNQGITYLMLGRYAEAILFLQKSIDLLSTDGDRAVAWNELGNLYRSLNDYENAVVAYRAADDLDADHAGLRDGIEVSQPDLSSHDLKDWNELGNLFLKTAAYPEAANCFGKAAEAEPMNARAHSNLAQSLVHQSRFEEAIPHYMRSIDLFENDKDRAASWNRLGNVYRRLNDYDNAIAAYQSAIKLNNEQVPLVTRARFSLLGNVYVE